MSCMLKPVLAGLAISSLCLAFGADLCAQGTAKKKAPIKRVQADDEELEQSPARPRTGSRANIEADGAEETSRPAPKSGKPQRPEPTGTLRTPILSPEVEKVLKDWESHTSQFKTMSLEFVRFTYDKTFEVEKRAEGSVVYAAPDKGNYLVKGMKIEPGEKSRKRNKNGVPYALKSDEPARWVCNGKEVIRIDDQAKPPTYEKAGIPVESQGQNIIDGPLPFLFGMKADRAKRRYRDIELLEGEEGEIRLQVRSKEDQDARAWDTAVIIIDAAKFTPKAVKLKDVTGAESVHVFKNVVVNKKKGLFETDPFNPSLKGYKQVLPPEYSKPASSPSGKRSAGPGDAPDLQPARSAESIAGNPSRKNSAGGARK